MKKIILAVIFGLVFLPLVFSATIGCGEEVERATDCVIRTPSITCNSTDIYNSSNEITINDFNMSEIQGGTGVYNFTFNANGTGIHSIVLCDNTSTQILVQGTDKTDLGTILSNQATLQNNIETVNDTVKAINASILENLTIQHGLTLILIGNINQSILTNISQSELTTTLGAAAKQDIGKECALQTLRQNLTIEYFYNRSDFSLVNITYNYTGLGIFINESLNYDNESFLVNTTRRDHLG